MRDVPIDVRLYQSTWDLMVTSFLPLPRQAVLEFLRASGLADPAAVVVVADPDLASFDDGSARLTGIATGNAWTRSEIVGDEKTVRSSPEPESTGVGLQDEHLFDTHQ